MEIKYLHVGISNREFGEGTLHSVLVKKLSDRHLENYSQWLSEHDREQSVLSLREWLKEE